MLATLARAPVLIGVERVLGTPRQEIRLALTPRCALVLGVFTN
jgi:hypothetical protein